MIGYYRIDHRAKARTYWVRAPTRDEAVQMFRRSSAYREQVDPYPVSPVPPRDCPRWIRQKEGTGVWEEVGERVPDRQAREDAPPEPGEKM